MSDTFSKVEVITGVARRRRFSTDLKLAVIAETMQPGMSISYVARRHGLSPSLVFRWRRLMSEGGREAVRADDEVVPAAELRRLEERLLRNPHPPDDLRHRRPRLRLLQREGNLLLGKPALLHGSAPPVRVSQNRKTRIQAGRGKREDVKPPPLPHPAPSPSRETAYPVGQLSVGDLGQNYSGAKTRRLLQDQLVQRQVRHSRSLRRLTWSRFNPPNSCRHR